MSMIAKYFFNHRTRDQDRRSSWQGDWRGSGKTDYLQFIFLEDPWGWRAWVVIGVECKPMHPRGLAESASNSIEVIVNRLGDSSHQLCLRHEFGINDVSSMGIIAGICNILRISALKENVRVGNRHSCCAKLSKDSQLLRVIFPLDKERFSYVSTSRARPRGLLYFPFHRSLSTERASRDRSTQFRVDTR